MAKALMVGSGFFPPERKIQPIGVELPEPEWTTLDINPECKPDYQFDLNHIEQQDPGKFYPLPFKDETFNEIHIYQTLEHFGRQGDFKGFFRTFREFWRILKPGGELYGDTPSLTSPWLWGDPGHARVILPQTLLFLTRKCYEGLGKNTSTDYRRFVDPCWWVILHSAEEEGRHGFVLRKAQ